MPAWLEEMTPVNKDQLHSFELDIDNLNYPVPVPEFQHIDNMCMNVLSREIYVNGTIDEDFGPWFTAALSYLEELSGEGITVWLNTPGGEEISMFTFHDLVRASSCHITTIGTGEVASAGVLMLACGHTRYVTESCVLMSHRGQGGVDGDYETIIARTKFIKWAETWWSTLMDRYSPEAVDGCRRDYSFWFNLGKKQPEWWLLGGAAIVHEGLADAIYPPKNHQG
jgi:ATP-dependent protease ClpP protease subunit